VCKFNCLRHSMILPMLSILYQRDSPSPPLSAVRVPKVSLSLHQKCKKLNRPPSHFSGPLISVFPPIKPRLIFLPGFFPLLLAPSDPPHPYPFPRFFVQLSRALSSPLPYFFALRQRLSILWPIVITPHRLSQSNMPSGLRIIIFELILGFAFQSSNHLPFSPRYLFPSDHPPRPQIYLAAVHASPEPRSLLVPIHFAFPPHALDFGRICVYRAFNIRCLSSPGISARINGLYELIVFDFLIPLSLFPF